MSTFEYQKLLLKLEMIIIIIIIILMMILTLRVTLLCTYIHVPQKKKRFNLWFGLLSLAIYMPIEYNPFYFDMLICNFYVR